MISVQNLAKRHGARTLFESVSTTFEAGHRYGIVGANGSGKSTLLRIIAGDEEPSDGFVQIPKRVRVGTLRQDHFQYEHVPILEVVLMGIPELWKAISERDLLLANAHEHFDADRYAELEDIVLQYDGYTVEARAGEILEGLNIETALHREPLSVLSGGFKLRVLLAQALASEPDLLLLDEPTNHLDILSIAWLESFLKSFKGCVITVSHDRRFLNAICTRILDVDYERVLIYKGDYDDFEELKSEDRDRMEAEIEKRETQIAQHRAFIDRFKAKPSKARQAQSKVKQMERIQIEDLPRSSRQYPLFRFKASRQTGKLVVAAHKISKSFGDKHVLQDVSIEVRRGDRLAIIGPNGVGKSTLLKIIMNLLQPDHGSIEWGHGAEAGYFSQGHDELEGVDEATIHDWLWNFCPERNTGFVRGKLAEVLFTKDDVNKRVGHLSGGEASRLLFARLNIQEPPVLVLDEPTNHLDLEGIEGLAAGLLDYDGTILFVSHDRWFVSQLATRIIEIRPDRLTDFQGTYDEFVYHCSVDHLDTEKVLAQARDARRKDKKSR
jgi:ATPase subunit of ABC transporter with duplicated ATPase domains